MQKAIALFRLLFWGWVSLSTLGAQPVVTHRAELSIDRRLGDAYTVLPLQEEGALVMLEGEEIKKRDRIYYFWCFDAQLQARWSKAHPIPFKYEFVNYTRSANNYYFLFQKGNQELIIFALDLSDGTGQLMTFDNIVKADIWQFVVLKHVALLGGESENKPFVVHLDMQTGKSKVLPSLQQMDTYLATIALDEVHERILVVLSGRVRRQKLVFANGYDLNGQRLYTHTIKNNNQYQLLDFKTYPVAADDWLILGAYAYKNWEKVQGVYSLRLQDPDQRPQVYAYDLANFKNYFNFYKEKRRQRLLRHAQNLRERGKRKRYQYDWFEQPLTLADDQQTLLFVADVYRPNYYAGRSTDALDPLNDPFRRSLSPYDVRSLYGYFYRYDPLAPLTPRRQRRLPIIYDYQSSFVCAFNLQGKPLWDNIFPLNGLSLRQPRSTVAFHLQQDSLYAFHLHEGQARFRSSWHSQTEPAIKDAPDWETQSNDTIRIVTQENEELQHWYGNSFLFSSKQRVRTTNPQVPIRKVFALTRIQYPARLPE